MVEGKTIPDFSAHNQAQGCCPGFVDAFCLFSKAVDAFDAFNFGAPCICGARSIDHDAWPTNVKRGATKETAAAPLDNPCVPHTNGNAQMCLANGGHRSFVCVARQPCTLCLRADNTRCVSRRVCSSLLRLRVPSAPVSFPILVTYSNTAKFRFIFQIQFFLLYFVLCDLLGPLHKDAEGGSKIKPHIQGGKEAFNHTDWYYFSEQHIFAGG